MVLRYSKCMKNTNCAIITGGGHGLGRAIALRLAIDQPVIIIGRDTDRLHETQQAVQAMGGVIHVVVGDIRDDHTFTSCLNTVRKQEWTISILVCNAGVGKTAPLHETSSGHWQAVLDTNVTSVHRWVSAVLPHMIAKQIGTICVISSVAGLHGVAYDSAYSASKHALVGLGKSMALEYGKYGIAVQILCPGFIAGDMTNRSITALAKRKGIDEVTARAIIAKQNPMKDIMPPEDVAETVAYLCTPAGRHLSGNPIVLGATS